jgi:hypothetical protein
MDAQELYEAYTADVAPADLLSQGRDVIASRLMLEVQLSEKAAYYEADQILVYTEYIEDDIPLRSGSGLEQQ